MTVAANGINLCKCKQLLFKVHSSVLHMLLSIIILTWNSKG